MKLIIEAVESKAFSSADITVLVNNEENKTLTPRSEEFERKMTELAAVILTGIAEEMYEKDYIRKAWVDDACASAKAKIDDKEAKKIHVSTSDYE